MGRNPSISSAGLERSADLPELAQGSLPGGISRLRDGLYDSMTTDQTVAAERSPFLQSGAGLRPEAFGSPNGASSRRSLPSGDRPSS